MRKGKILQVSVFLSCCCLNSFAYNISMSDNIGKQTASIVKAAALKDLGTQQSSDNVKVTGTVVDNTGEPIIGATVRVKNSQSGTATDLDGKFTLSVPKGSTLIISYIGMLTQEVQVTGAADLKISMKDEAHKIDEVVVTALGIKRS